MPADNKESKSKDNNPLQLPDNVLASLKTFFESGGKVTRRAEHAYYTIENANQVKIILEKVFKERKPVKLIVPKSGSVNSIRQQWYEGARFLRTRLDPEKIYHHMYRNVRCTTGVDYIEIVPKLTIRTELAHAEILTSDDNSWKDRYKEWLDSNPELLSRFHEKNIALSDADILWAKEQLSGVETLFVAKFERNEVLVIRYDDKEETNEIL